MSKKHKITSAEVKSEQKAKPKRIVEMLCITEEDLRLGDIDLNCRYLAIVVRPGARNVPDYAFKGVDVDTVYLPNSTKYIGYESFENSTIRKVLVREEKNNKMSGVYKPLKSKPISIGKAAFRGCKNLQVLEPEIAEIKDLAFEGAIVDDDTLNTIQGTLYEDLALSGLTYRT